MGFVMQDDVLFPTLTVRESLVFAALLRLPNSMSQAQKIQRADDVLQELGLERYLSTALVMRFSSTLLYSSSTSPPPASTPQLRSKYFMCFEVTPRYTRDFTIMVKRKSVKA